MWAKKKMAKRRANIGIALGALAIALALLVYAFVSDSPVVSGQEPPPLPPNERRGFDADGNKVFDNLEFTMAGAAPQDSLGVIIQFNQDLDRVDFAGLRQAAGLFSIRHRFNSINGISTNLTKGRINALARMEVVKQIELDAQVFASNDTAKVWFGVKKAQADFGFDGNADGLPTYSKDDLVIAIMDSGIDTGHVDLDGGKVLVFRDAINGLLTAPFDDAGACNYHGTHVASIAAGAGDGDPTLAGVAPGAALVGVKVLASSGSSCSGSVSQVVAGVQWVIDNKATYGIDVMNMSLGDASCSNGLGALSTVVNAAVDSGIIAVVSAGNLGWFAHCTIGEPAAAEKAVTVGSFAGVEALPATSSRPGRGFYRSFSSGIGPTADNRIKPDVMAPGVKIDAVQGGTLNLYTQKTGTSMSSPFAAGVAALMLQGNSAQTPAQVKATMMSTALDWGPTGADVEYGAGRLDAYEAIRVASSETGIGPAVPGHQAFTDTLIGPGDFDVYSVNVTNMSFPIAGTMIMTDIDRPSCGNSSLINTCFSQFIVLLIDPNGITVPTSNSFPVRQQTFGVMPAMTGTYSVRVESHPSTITGTGVYSLDVSAGSQPPVVAISLLTDGTTPFGVQSLGTTVDTTSSGTDDTQTAYVLSGPADLVIRSTVPTSNGDTWSLGTGNGPDTALWQFSPDGTTWTTFTDANLNFPLVSGLSHDSSQNVDFRMTLPTSSSGSAEYNVAVTIVAIAP